MSIIIAATRCCSCIHASSKHRLFFPARGVCPNRGRPLNVDLLETLELGDWGQTARARARYRPDSEYCFRAASYVDSKSDSFFELLTFAFKLSTLALVTKATASIRTVTVVDVFPKIFFRQYVCRVL